MKAAVALVLLLNGVQVYLGAPALRVEGTACVPLRAVCERVGVSVQAVRGTGSVALKVPGRQAVPVRVVPSFAASTGLVALNLQGVTYAPARPLAEALGGACRWDAGAAALDLRIPWQGAAARVSLARLRADPLALRGRTVEVAGQSEAGWGQRGSLSWDSPGPGELALEDGGAVKVSRLGAAVVALPPGTRVTARGRVGLLGDATPWLQAAAIERAEGGAALRLDRAACRAGGVAAVELWGVQAGGGAGAAAGDVVSPMGAGAGPADLRWLPDAAGVAREGVWRTPRVAGRAGAALWRLRIAGAEAEVRLGEPALGGGDGGG
jgi:hypothetical protein